MNIEKTKTPNRSSRELREQREKRIRSDALNRFIATQEEAARDAIANILILAGGLIFAALCLITAVMGWK